ncbi:MAG: radical SAM protein [Oligoflexia bacterium]|nr:radical SAM protein [Oligoflexia bacterium]
MLNRVVVSEKNLKRFQEFQYEKFGKRYLDYRKHWESPLEEILSQVTFPMYLMLEQSFLCNLKCITCIHSDKHTGYKKKHLQKSVMPIDLLDSILAQAKSHSLPAISMHSNDEPLLLKDIDVRIKKCREADIMEIFLTTNGTLMNESVAEKIIQAGVSHVLFSIDAAEASTYEKIRGESFFDKVLLNIKNFNKIRNALNGGLYPIIRASFVVSRYNQTQINDFISKFSSFVDFIEFQSFQKFHTETDDFIPLGAKQVQDFSCSEVFKKLIIRANGDILPCCTWYGYDLVLGNVYRDKLEDIFNNNAQLNLIRENSLSKNYSLQSCQQCSKSFYAL